MKHLSRLAAAGLFVTALSVSPAKAGTIIFTYTVTGNGHINFVPPILTYSFEPDAAVATPLGLLDVRYQSNTGIDFSLSPPSGLTTSTWNFGQLGKFGGTGNQIGAIPVGDLGSFTGTSIISTGDGIFAGASGTTSYSGSAFLSTGVTTFTERIVITAPALQPVPEPAAVLLLAVGSAVTALRQRRRRRQTVSGSERTP